MIELVCPESCAHLTAARSQASERKAELRKRELTAEGRPPARLTNREMRLVDFIFQSIIKTQRGHNGSPVRNLIDSEVKEAVENAIKNFETEESGIIYEHHAATPRIEEVSRRIRASLADLARNVAAEWRPRRQEMLSALRYIASDSEAHIKRNPTDAASRDFLRFIALHIPWPEPQAETRIIMP
jgi:hypothetical protein